MQQRGMAGVERLAGEAAPSISARRRGIWRPIFMIATASTVNGLAQHAK